MAQGNVTFPQYPRKGGDWWTVWQNLLYLANNLGSSSVPLGLPKITVASISSAPASPADGDIWIATGITSVFGAIKWQFSWDAANSRWAFIGGPPIEKKVASGAFITPVTTFVNPHGANLQITTPRAGAYQADLTGRFNNTTTAQSITTELMFDGGNDGRSSDVTIQAGWLAKEAMEGSNTIGAGKIIQPLFYANADTFCSCDYMSLRVHPIYVT